MAVLVLPRLLWFYVNCWILSACQSYFMG